jgi:hypothetical protein
MLIKCLVKDYGEAKSSQEHSAYQKDFVDDF